MAAPGEAIAQVQLEYGLLTREITVLSLGAATDADCLEGMKHVDNIPKNTLLIRDLAYFSPKTFHEFNTRELFFVSRAKSQWSIYEQTEDVLYKITFEQILARSKNQKDKYLDLDVLIGEAKVPVRLIAPIALVCNEGLRDQRFQRFLYI